jgi:DNA invertase Pin-like site-specific DNA recombinase
MPAGSKLESVVGMTAAKARGTHLGRKRKLSYDQLEHAQALTSEGRSRAEVARLLNVNPSTLYRRLVELRATQ